MSVRNGDKARFGKEQKKKLLRRKNTLAVRQSLESKALATTTGQVSAPKAPPTPAQAPEPGETTPS